jgi:hypothetical protein
MKITDRREAIKMADNVLRGISDDPDMRAKIRSRLKFQTDLNTTIAKQVKQAWKEERERTLNRIALNALAKGIPLADIAEITGLTTEQIELLRSGE